MDAPSRGSRVTLIRIGAALLVAGVLSLGAMGCGSSDSESSESASNVPNKEAGGLPTQEAGGVATVPKLIGMPQFKADNLGRAHGFSVSTTWLDAGDEPNKACGTGGDGAYVVDQSPQPGTEASTDQPIEISVPNCDP